MSQHRLHNDLEQAWMKSTGRIKRTPAGRLEGWGTTPGNGVQGWAPGASWVNTTTGIEYRNRGTSSAAVWMPVGPEPLVSCFFDDFFSEADYHTYTSNDDGVTGTNTFTDAAFGQYNVVTAAADNDYHAMSTEHENWLFASAKPLWFEARLKVAEATTNESAWWVGLTDTLTTGGFQANAAGPLASYDGALFWKDEATMALDFESSNATTQDTESALATVVTDTWTTVAFYVDGTATTSVITPYYNVGGGMTLTAGTAVNITLSGLAEMHLVFGVKAGPTAGAETLQMDYVRCLQVR